MEIEDKAPIESMVCDYGERLDQRDFERWLELFAAEGTYQVILRSNHERGEPLFLIDEELVRLRRRIKSYAGDLLPATLHLMGRITVDAVDAGRAQARVPGLVLRRGEPVFAGRYFFNAARNDAGKWLIERVLLVLENENIADEIQVPI